MIEKREEECKNYPDDCKDEEFWKEEMNRQIEERWHIGFELPIVFIDSWSQKKPHDEDPTEQKYFTNETQKLWDFAISKGDFKFRNIDEVIDENEELHKENDELRSENKVLMIANERLLNETETLQDQNYLLKQDNTRLTKENNELEKDNDELRQDNEQLNVDNALLQSDNDRLKVEKSELIGNLTECTTEKGYSDGNLTECHSNITNFFTTSAIRGIYVQIGSNGCNHCDMEVTVYNSDGEKCETDKIDSDRNDWQPYNQYAYWGSGSIGNCDKWDAKRGVWKINVQHSGKGGVTIDHWRILTDSGSYHCPGGFFDNDDSDEVTCVRGNGVE